MEIHDKSSATSKMPIFHWPRLSGTTAGLICMGAHISKQAQIAFNRCERCSSSHRWQVVSPVVLQDASAQEEGQQRGVHKGEFCPHEVRSQGVKVPLQPSQLGVQCLSRLLLPLLVLPAHIASVL